MVRASSPVSRGSAGEVGLLGGQRHQLVGVRVQRVGDRDQPRGALVSAAASGCAAAAAASSTATSGRSRRWGVLSSAAVVTPIVPR